MFWVRKEENIFPICMHSLHEASGLDKLAEQMMIDLNEGKRINLINIYALIDFSLTII